MENFDEFNRNNQAYRYESTVENEVSSKSDSHLLSTVYRTAYKHTSEIILTLASEVTINGTAETAKNFKGENQKNYIVDFFLNVACFC